MKSVMIFDPKETREERMKKFSEWRNQNGMSAVGDKAVPNAEETRKMLHGK